MDLHLAERAVEDEGVLAAGGPRELRQPRREAAAGEVVRPRDVRLVAPLLIPFQFPHPQHTKRNEKTISSLIGTAAAPAEGTYGETART